MTPTTGQAALDSPPSTRERLISAAIELFAERGYEGTSVGDIETCLLYTSDAADE